MNRGKSILTVNSLEDLWGIQLPKLIREKYANWALEVSYMTWPELSNTLLKVLRDLEGDLKLSGPHRKQDWINGWSENLESFRSERDLVALLPGYFEKSDVLRFNQEWVLPGQSNAESQILGIIVQSFALIVLDSCESIYEFGCGTGSNLISLREVLPSTKLIGLDWAESSNLLVSEVAAIRQDPNMKALNFDFFAPDFSIDISPQSGVLTVAAIEQTGSNYREFVDYLLHQNPEVVLHIEPFEEVLDDDNLLDYLSIRYFKKRNYLKGFLEYLSFLEQSGRVEILDIRRTFIGSLFIEGYSVCAWRPRSV